MTEKKKQSDQWTSRRSFPNIAEWVEGCGLLIDIGHQDWQGFVVRALDGGGMVYEKEGCKTPWAEALMALENGLEKWLDENG